MIRMIRMIVLSQTPAWCLGSAQWDVAEAANLPDVRKCSKRYNLHYFRARRRSSLLSQRSLIRSPPQARLCVFLRKYQWLAQYCAPDCSHSNIVGVGRSRIILWIILLAFQAYIKMHVADLQQSAHLLRRLRNFCNGPRVELQVNTLKQRRLVLWC